MNAKRTSLCIVNLNAAKKMAVTVFCLGLVACFITLVVWFIGWCSISAPKKERNEMWELNQQISHLTIVNNGHRIGFDPNYVNDPNSWTAAKEDQQAMRGKVSVLITSIRDEVKRIEARDVWKKHLKKLDTWYLPFYSFFRFCLMIMGVGCVPVFLACWIVLRLIYWYLNRWIRQHGYDKVDENGLIIIVRCLCTEELRKSSQNLFHELMIKIWYFSVDYQLRVFDDPQFHTDVLEYGWRKWDPLKSYTKGELRALAETCYVKGSTVAPLVECRIHDMPS